MKRKNKKFLFIIPVFILTAIILSPSLVKAGGCTSPDTVDCQVDMDCFQLGCNHCVQCINGFCHPNDAFCENLDGNNACVTAACNELQFNPVNPTGCEYTVSVFNDPAGTFGDLCYYCDPARITTIDTCGNGVCNVDQGEDCGSCPEDCQVPGWDQPGCPVSPNDINHNTCLTSITFPGPPFNTPNGFNCEDGDVCTSDFCSGQGTDGCVNQPKSCSLDTSDLCCASGCEGPPVPMTCREAIAAGILTDTECDIDCWPPAVCEDGLVQNPETCDDGLPGDSAGINVTDAQCRNANEPGACTYCGDGFLQPEAGEQCEVGLIGSCGTSAGAGECDLTTCQCVENLCVTGSGNIWNDINPGCANCSFHSNATSQGWFHDYQAILFLAGILSLGLMWRWKKVS